MLEAVVVVTISGIVNRKKGAIEGIKVRKKTLLVSSQPCENNTHDKEKKKEANAKKVFFYVFRLPPSKIFFLESRGGKRKG